MKDADEKAPTAQRRQIGESSGAPPLFDAAAVQVRTEAALAFANDMGRIAVEAASDHVDALMASQRRLASAVQDLAKVRQAPDVIAVQARFVQGFVESSFDYARTWTDHARKVGDCCAALVRAPAGGEADAKPEATPSRRADKSTER